MAKEKGEKTNLYLLAIVGIVAIVGVVVLILNSGSTSMSTSSSDDLSGQATKVLTTKETLEELRKLQEELKAKFKEIGTVNEEGNPLCPAPCGSQMARMCGQEC